MNKYYAEVFDLKNTAITQTIDFLKTKDQYINWAKDFSLKKEVDHIIIYNGTAWNEYNKGKLVSYSFPNGI